MYVAIVHHPKKVKTDPTSKFWVKKKYFRQWSMAFALSLLNDQDLTQLTYNNPRTHLGHLSTFASTPTYNMYRWTRSKQLQQKKSTVSVEVQMTGPRCVHHSSEYSTCRISSFMTYQQCQLCTLHQQHQLCTSK